MFYQNSEGKLYNLSLVRLINKRECSDYFAIFFDGSVVETFKEEFDTNRFLIWLKEQIKAGSKATSFFDYTAKC
ncbi:MAG TPA: hypothetical protein PK411_13630 [Mesotoga infera]|nr:hypothetical protein [Mesotoga infera]